MSFLSGNDPANESAERIHRLVQLAHEGYTAERLYVEFYAEVRGIYTTKDHRQAGIAMRELMEAMEEARAVIGD